MKKITCFVFVAVILLIGFACRQRDIRTVTIDVPRMQGEECAGIVYNVLASLNGVRAESLEMEPGAVTVTYDSMRLALKNLEYALAEAGFQANEIPPDPDARERLPERCR